LDPSGFAWSLVAGCYKHGNEPAGSIKDKKILDCLSYYFPKKDFAPWNELSTTKRYSVAVSTVLRIRQVLGVDLDPQTGYVEIYRGFTQTLPPNSRTVSFHFLPPFIFHSSPVIVRRVRDDSTNLKLHSRS
jgi:hypothetical protein